MKKFISNKNRPVKKFLKGSGKPNFLANGAINQISDKLKDSEIRYRRLFESAKDGILILEMESGKIIDANPYIVEIIDYPLEDILGKELWEIGLFSNKQEAQHTFDELKSKGYIRFEDMPIPRRNGGITEVEFICNVYVSNKKKVIQCNIRNITQRKINESKIKESEHNFKIQNAELIKSKARAEESDKLKSTFLANMSHEIRTPMNAIMGYSGFLLEPDLPRTKQSEFVQIIVSSCQQLLTIISDILDISKIETGQITVETHNVNITVLLKELFETYLKTTSLKNIDLEYMNASSSETIEMISDGNRIKQILCNLLNNAVKFTKTGKITFGYQLQEHVITFYVKDTGIGIAPENLAVIFHHFIKIETEYSDIYGGNGLGLSISQALVEKLGGSITVSSALGKGTTFQFTVPYFTRKRDIATNTLEPHITAKPLDSSKKIILIVEDELYSHMYLEELLANKNFKILHAWDGQEAIEQVKGNDNISLVLMDMKMPTMNGLEATRQIKQIRPQLPIIAQTAFVNNKDKEEAVAAGCDDFLSKPINKDACLKIINAYLI